MILCKYSKTGSSVYVPHLDVLRDVGRAVRRANLDISYSEGFNPHMLLFFSQPLPLGMVSLCEYFCAVSKEKPSVFMEALNSKLPVGLRIIAAAECDNANVHALISHAEYRFKGEKTFTAGGLNGIMSRIEIKIPLKTKKGVSETDIRPRIFALKEDNGDALATVSCGRENLRADALGRYLAEEFEMTDIPEAVKERAFAMTDGKLKPVDDIFNLCI